ncbi:MAG: hypothetical protein IJO38_06065 [Akkermansia sp.]|nr:hypothetical protein [Akkermansia sp.]
MLKRKNKLTEGLKARFVALQARQSPSFRDVVPLVVRFTAEEYSQLCRAAGVEQLSPAQAEEFWRARILDELVPQARATVAAALAAEEKQTREAESYQEEHAPAGELSFMNGAGVPKAEVAFGAAEVLSALADHVFAPVELVAELDERLADARKYVRGDEEVAVRVCLWKVRVAKNAEERAEARRELSKAWNELLGLSKLGKARREQAAAAKRKAQEVVLKG